MQNYTCVAVLNSIIFYNLKIALYIILEKTDISIWILLVHHAK